MTFICNRYTININRITILWRCAVIMGENEKVEELREIYDEMDDEGKEKMVSVVEEYLNRSDDQKGENEV